MLVTHHLTGVKTWVGSSENILFHVKVIVRTPISNKFIYENQKKKISLHIIRVKLWFSDRTHHLTKSNIYVRQQKKQEHSHKDTPVTPCELRLCGIKY